MTSTTTSIPPRMPAPCTTQVERGTRAWPKRAVLELNLCPFAKGVHAKGQVRYAVGAAARPRRLPGDLARPSRALAEAAPEARDTTLLLAPGCLHDFLDQAEAALAALGLERALQTASFHPRYRLAGVRSGDTANHTNRAPHPTPCLPRENSIGRAVQTCCPEAQVIFERNAATPRALRHAGRAVLPVGAGQNDAGATP